MAEAGSSVLDSIVAGVREDLARREQLTSMESLKARAARLPSAIDARQILARDEVAVIAEVKVGSSRVDLQACKLEYSIVSPK